MKPSFSIFPLGDSAVTIDLGNDINEELNRKALAIRQWLEAHPPKGILDIIVAYSSVSIYYDPEIFRKETPACRQGAYACLRQLLETAWEEVAAAVGTIVPAEEKERPIIEIPVCYEGEYAPDLESFARMKALSPDEVVRLHTAPLYQVYMIGFLPGFPYLGTVDPKLAAPRKPMPFPVIAGGVGIAGSQTGIYTLNSPGGWHIIGRTPIRLFDPVADPPVRLKTGDKVRFSTIPAADFREF